MARQRYGQVRGDAADFAAFPAFATGVDEAQQAAPRRLQLDGENVERGLVQLVLSLVELLRRLMEKQALRRVEESARRAAEGLPPTLGDDQIERLGETLEALAAQMRTLQAHFKIEDLNLDLGPLGNLLD